MYNIIKYNIVLFFFLLNFSNFKKKLLEKKKKLLITESYIKLEKLKKYFHSYFHNRERLPPIIIIKYSSRYYDGPLRTN